MSLLGLKRGTVTLIPHQQMWETAAAETIAHLRKFFPDADIAHVGSTSIPHIAAKPIIDIAVGVDDLSAVKEMAPMLETHGLLFRGEVEAGQLLFVIGDLEADRRSHHIHFVKRQGREWQNYIRFRDYLTAHPARAKDYERLKIRLAERYSADRASYTAGKADLIQEILAESALET